MFAIIDIETTGGNPEKDKITEIAILIFDGQKVVKTFESLINPQRPIPSYISQLTGISNEMVENAPCFYEIAKEIVEITENTIFVAHNVRFDYNFVKAEFKSLGYNFTKKTLCTVRLSRKVFKGLPSYSLGKLCISLGIELENRHRAMGDAKATTIVFEKIHKTLSSIENNWYLDEIPKTSLPSLLPNDILDKIPENLVGVYYFYNSDHQIVYVGKSKDIKKRIIQHFAMGIQGSRRALQLKKEIADIGFEPTGNELIALLLESDEIKKHKPIYNIQQKKIRAIPCYGVYLKTDADGYLNFEIEPYQESSSPIITAESISKAREILYKFAEKFNLCLSKIDIQKIKGPCFNYHVHQCKGACIKAESTIEYNERMMLCVEKNSFNSETFLLLGKGREINEISVVKIEFGQYKGFGFMNIESEETTLENMLACVKKYAHNRDIQQILCSIAVKGMKKVPYQSQLI